MRGRGSQILTVEPTRWNSNVSSSERRVKRRSPFATIERILLGHVTATKKQRPPRISKEASSKTLILVVDDLEDSRFMYAEYLRHVGYRVDTAADGMSAVRKARELLPAVIIMDLSLPVMDGWEATRTLKDDPKTAHICILAVSGHGEPPYRERAMDAGATAFLIKPCIPSEVAAKIEECLSASSRRRRKA